MTTPWHDDDLFTAPKTCTRSESSCVFAAERATASACMDSIID